MKLTKDFTVEEVQCKCGCLGVPTPAFMQRLQQLRDAYGKSMKVTSGFRCKTHNKKIGGAAKSKHVEGIAVDVQVEDRWELVKHMFALKFHGVGIASSFIHIDDRPEAESAVWVYSNK